jgi:hypothetical protein
MTRTANRTGASTPFTAWTTIFYLLLVFIAPFALLGSAHAQEDESPQENYGTGKNLFRSMDHGLVLTGGISYRY